MIDGIQRPVLAQACAWMRSLHDRGSSTLGISVNLSNATFAHSDFVAEVKETLARTALEPASLRLEITERALFADDPAVRVGFDELHQLGVQWHLDDFGTGYSSLGTLGSFPIQTLKIDRSFVARMEQEERSRKIVCGILSLARDLGMGVIAEGIEKPAQVILLRELGCPEGQGFHFAPPLEPAEAERLVETQLVSW